MAGRCKKVDSAQRKYSGRRVEHDRALTEDLRGQYYVKDEQVGEMRVW